MMYRLEAQSRYGSPALFSADRLRPLVLACGLSIRDAVRPDLCSNITALNPSSFSSFLGT